MRVLFASPHGKDSGGIARFTDHILDYYGSLQNREVELELLPTGRDGVDIFINNKFSRLCRGVYDYTIIIKKLIRLLKNNHYDVLHISSSASLGLMKDFLMIKIANHYHVKTIVHFHFGRIPLLSRLNNWEWKLLLKVVHLSNMSIVLDEKSLQALVGAKVKNLIKLPNPISPSVLSIIQNNNHQERHQREILFVGHCYPAKGVVEAVKACMQLKDIRLILIGSITDEMKQSLTNISKNADWLDIKGEMPYDEVIKQMLTCSIFILPSYTEGFPNVIIEAMACACPIIATDVGAIPEMLKEENGIPYGYIIKPKNAEDLEKGIVKMLEDDSFRKECGENAQKRVRTQYSMPSIWNQLLNCWSNC